MLCLWGWTSSTMDLSQCDLVIQFSTIKIFAEAQFPDYLSCNPPSFVTTFLCHVTISTMSASSNSNMIESPNLFSHASSPLSTYILSHVFSHYQVYLQICCKSGGAMLTHAHHFHLTSWHCFSHSLFY